MSQKPPPTPAEQLCAVIDAHKYSPLVVASPLGKVLPLVRQFVIAQEHAILQLKVELKQLRAEFAGNAHPHPRETK